MELIFFKPISKLKNNKNIIGYVMNGDLNNVPWKPINIVKVLIPINISLLNWLNFWSVAFLAIKPIIKPWNIIEIIAPNNPPKPIFCCNQPGHSW